MNDPANVCLVDSHPERDRRHDDASISIDEVVLDGFPVVRFHAGVIERDLLDTFRDELGDEIFSLRLGRHVNDDGFVSKRFEEGYEDGDLAFLIRGGLDQQREVASVCASREDTVFDIYVESVLTRADVLDDGRGCSCSESEDSFGGDFFREARNLEVFGTEGRSCTPTNRRGQLVERTCDESLGALPHSETQ